MAKDNCLKIQRLANQSFTTICINLQMWLSSGFEVAEFAFSLDPYMNVSKLFQGRREKPSSISDLQIGFLGNKCPPKTQNKTKTQRIRNVCTQLLQCQVFMI